MSPGSAGSSPPRRNRANSASAWWRLVRPEAIAISGDAAASGMAAHGRHATYLGEKVEYELTLAGAKVQAIRFNPPSTERFAPGTVVKLRLPTEDVQLLGASE